MLFLAAYISIGRTVAQSQKVDIIASDVLHQPIPGAQLRVFKRDAKSSPAIYSNKSDAGGKFTLPSEYLHSSDLQVEISHVGYRTSSRRTADLNRNPEIQLIRRCDLSNLGDKLSGGRGDLDSFVLDLLICEPSIESKFLTNVLYFESDLAPALSLAMTHSNDIVALRAMTLACTLGLIEDIRPLLEQSSRFEDLKRRAQVETLVASTLPRPISDEQWSHVSSCLRSQFGQIAFQAALNGILINGSKEEFDRLQGLLNEPMGEFSPAENRRLLRRAIKVHVSDVKNHSEDGFVFCLRRIMRLLARLYNVRSHPYLTAYNRSSSKALVFFDLRIRGEAFLYVACFKETEGHWHVASIRCWALS
jgi:hypothetical protein